MRALGDRGKDRRSASMPSSPRQGYAPETTEAIPRSPVPLLSLSSRTNSANATANAVAPITILSGSVPDHLKTVDDIVQELKKLLKAMRAAGKKRFTARSSR
jgi:hypothetical protein